MDIRGWLRALRKNWWIVLLTAVLSCGVGVVMLVLTPPTYASSVTFFANTSGGDAGNPVQGDQYGQRRVNSYVQLLDSERLADLVLADSQLNMTADQIIRAITAKGDTNTVMLTATVTDTSPERSLDIATSVSKTFVAMVADLETPPGGTTPTVRLEVTSGPTLQLSPVAPRPLYTMGIALAVGLILGVCLAVLREALDNTVRSAVTLKAASGTAVLGVIAFDETAKQSPLIVESHSRSIRAEAFRQLRTNLQFVDVDNPVKVLVVTSSVAEEGKSSTATNLAVSFAEAGQKVLLIEGDLRRPRVADYLGLESAVGLTNVLAGQVEVDDVLQTWGRGGLTVLPSGSIPPNPSELLGSRNMSDLLAALKVTFEIIIIDSPPLLPVADAAIVAAHADGAVLVVRYGSTKRQQVASAVDTLAAVDARLLGAVLNRAPTRGVDSYSYGYGYYTDESSTRERLESVEIIDTEIPRPEEAQTSVS